MEFGREDDTQVCVRVDDSLAIFSSVDDSLA
jgi:hypothetical protein